MTSRYTQDLQYAIELARGAGKVILDHFGKVARLTKTHAATTDEAVTEADRAAQRYIVEGLRRRFPEDGIVGEESETGDSITFECPNPEGRNWVIDPIDGTNNFIAGMGNFAVCIGLLEAGYPVLGVVYDVTRDLMYAAARGEGAWMGTTPLRAPDTPMSNASLLMLSSNLIKADGSCPQWACRWIGQTDWKVRILGSAALEAIHVAAGIAHAAVTVNGKLWDIAAPAAIVLEADGVVVSPTGEDVFPFRLANYAGAKVPFIAAGKQAAGTIVEEMRNHP